MLVNSVVIQLFLVSCLSEQLTKVKFSNLDKILYPKPKITKKQIIEYYIKIAPRILDLVAERAIVTTRFPDGVEEKGFFGKDAPQGTPEWVKTVEIYSKSSRRDVNYLVIDDVDTLIWLGNMAALEIHMPLSRIDERDKPDFVLFDIDPEPPATFQNAIDVALFLKDRLDQLSLDSYVKTSGKKGLHIVVPIQREYKFSVTREFAHIIGQHLAKQMDIVVSEFPQTKEKGKVFLDYTQNAHGKTMVIPYGLRATPDATVSTPLAWTEVKKGLKPEAFNLLTVTKHKEDPWKEIFTNRQKLVVK